MLLASVALFSFVLLGGCTPDTTIKMSEKPETLAKESKPGSEGATKVGSDPIKPPAPPSQHK
jgi:hypothetical protein